MARFLFIRPNYQDEAMVYNVLTLPIKDAALSLNHEVISLEADATPTNIWQTIQETNPDIVFSVGHGCTDIHTVIENQDCFWSGSCGERYHTGDNVDMLSQRVVYLLSCECGLRLIPKIFNDGAGVAAGYVDIWYWVVDESYPPANDPYAKPFFDAANTFIIALLSGKTAQKAFQQTIDRYNYWIGYYENWLVQNPNAPSSERVRAMSVADLLEYDRDILVVYSNEGTFGTTSVSIGGDALKTIVVYGGLAVIGLMILKK